MTQEFEAIIDRICEEDFRYRRDVYPFAMEVLSYTQKRFGRPKHVRGEEFLEGFKELLLERFGPLALTVLNHWGIHRTEDIGNVVFNLVDNRVLGRTEEDCREDFHNGFDFMEVFQRSYQRELERKINQMR